MLTIPTNAQTIFNISEKGIFKDLLQLFLLFGLAVFFVYYAPSILNKIFFFITLVLFYRSKKDYIWFAFVFLLIMAPGTIFKTMAATDHNIPKIGFGKGLELGFFAPRAVVAHYRADQPRGARGSCTTSALT